MVSAYTCRKEQDGINKRLKELAMRYGQKIKKKKINLKYLTGLNQDCYNTKNNGPLGLADKAECYRKESMGWEEYRPRTECKHCHSAAM